MSAMMARTGRPKKSCTRGNARRTRCKANENSILMLMATAAALTGVFAMSAIKPAEAQRKSIRWATSSVDTYGYKVAASMTKMVEEALGGEYTVTVNPYPQTTAPGRRRWMAMPRSATPPISACARSMTAPPGSELHAAKGQAGAHLVRLSDGIVHGDDGSCAPTRYNA